MYILPYIHARKLPTQAKQQQFTKKKLSNLYLEALEAKIKFIASRSMHVWNEEQKNEKSGSGIWPRKRAI